DLDSCMGSAQPDICLGNRGHPDEVVSSRKEGCESRGERSVTTNRHRHRRCDQLLLSNVHLEISLRIRLGKSARKRGVAHFSVCDENVVSYPYCFECVAVCCPSRYLFAQFVARQCER